MTHSSDSSPAQPVDILIVDDTPDNLRLLSSMLLEQGYKVRKAMNGKRAIQAVEAILPDLILLDIMMPEMNGYEVAKFLKESVNYQDIPIIFLSALNDPLDKVLAFDVGGVDYISKPFHVQDVLVRVKTQLMIRQQQKQLQAQNEQLKQEIQHRQNIESKLSLLIHAISQDLKNPMTIILKGLKSLLTKNLVSDSSGIIVPRDIIARMVNSCDRQLTLINSLVETTDIEIQGVSLECKPLSIYTFIQTLVADWQPIITKNQALLKSNISQNLPLVKADSHQLLRIFEHLFSNAIKYNAPGITLTVAAEVISVENHPSFVRCTVSDNGVGINSEDRSTLFHLSQRENHLSKIKGLGLGLYLCRQIITAHGGKIGVISSPNQGATFWFTLPVWLE
ncbi:hybrid sensor histidine kinase/response regulator [Planktothrix mougeotii]|uniref:histidine kinase n=1 Tax=Planktothrix mougeotii LEGE 06226 TaxID=1828728 RepID=A0ABR9U5I6_9CYAN|nr:hybrid sensor histidine kinase/response regulator [Planktothrix mougeotii]MBE9141677.1 hybrid sensor histidine kinase/response regulator [Planktothrix mougeotii LEGE 06226]